MHSSRRLPTTTNHEVYEKPSSNGLKKQMDKRKSRKGIHLSAPVEEKLDCHLVAPAEQVDKAPEAYDGNDEDACDQQTPALTPTMDITAEQFLAGLGLPPRYQVVELLGEGGMAHVYKALDTECGGNPVAIKILRPEIVPDPTIVERFFREAKAAQRLSHPCTVSVSDYGTTSTKMPYLIMEFVPGRNLGQIISDEGHLSEHRAVRIFWQIAEGLKEAHRLGMVHRDLKPSNILIATNDDGTESVKIADFGIAKPASSERWIDPDLTKTGAILGSPAYMSPEQCLGHVVDERSDIYSLGCLMYETVSGRSPFASDTPVKSMIRHLEDNPEPFEIEHNNLHISTGLEAMIMKCLAKEPAKRFQTVYQLQHALPRSLDPGVVRRFCSDAIDTAALLLSCTAVVYMSRILLASMHLRFLDGEALGLSLLFPFIFSVALAGLWTYLEADKGQKTPGKALTGLKVIDSTGTVSPIVSFASAAAVITFIQVVGHIALGINTIMNALGGASFMNYAIGLICFGGVGYLIWSPAFFNNGRQNLFELLNARTVVPDDEAQSGPNIGKGPVSRRLLAVAVVLLIFAAVMFQYSLSNQLLQLSLRG
jgi:serine/threonine protein kinase